MDDWYELNQEAIARDRKWTDALLPEVKEICGREMFVEADDMVDKKENADLVLRLPGRGDIAVRIREYKYFQPYKYEITIRSYRAGKHKTEMDKLLEGRGLWMFYGFATEDKKRIKDWTIISLDAFRAARLKRLIVPCSPDRDNGDGTRFTPYDMRTFFGFEPRIIVASSMPELHALGRVAFGEWPEQLRLKKAV
jgi:hypothetical protein